MFYLGKNIRSSPAEVLVPISVQGLVETIQNPNSSLANETSRLRRIAQIDPKTFKTMKLTLPYFIPATFKDNCRHSDNFIEIKGLVIDFDDCLKTPAQSQQLISQITQQPDVFLAFVSPNGRGIKVVFSLAAPLNDLHLFKRFYLDYARDFAERVRLLGTLDTRTSDATRVCFLIHDANVYYNASAVTLNWQLWAEKNTSATVEHEAEFLPTASEMTKMPLTPEIHRELVLKVNPKAPVKPKIEPHVPLLLKEVEEPIRKLLKKNGITVLEIRHIHYGLKIYCKVPPQLAEVNVFYGKRGFSVVMSAKAATSAELNKRVYELVFEYLFNVATNAT